MRGRPAWYLGATLVLAGMALFACGWALGRSSVRTGSVRSPITAQYESRTLRAALRPYTGAYPQSWFSIKLVHDPEEPYWVEYVLSGIGRHATQVQGAAGFAVLLGGQWRIVVEPSTQWANLCNQDSSSYVPAVVRADFGTDCGV
jgi:hypothetical protein